MTVLTEKTLETSSLEYGENNHKSQGPVRYLKQVCYVMCFITRHLSVLLDVLLLGFEEGKGSRSRAN